MKKIAVLVRKGGSGKTTTAVHLAAGLAANRKKVLLVDADPQGHAGISFGKVPGKNSLAELIISEPGEFDIADYIQELRPNLYGILSDIRLDKAVKILSGEDYPETKLKRLLANLDGFDYVIFDCNPSFNMINQNILLYIDNLVIPCNMEYFTLRGLKELEEQLTAIQTKVNHNININYVVPTFYDSRNKKSAEVIEVLTKRFGEKVVDPIRINAKISEAATANMPVYEYDQTSNGALDYAKFVKRVIKDGQ